MLAILERMGCICSKSHHDDDEDVPVQITEPPKQYSWDLRPKINPADYTVDSSACDQVVVRKPGSINGQAFIIKDCKNSKIFLLDHFSQVTIDDCYDCCIVLGPIQGSIFIRDCKNCVFILACQQFRLRDCYDFQVFLSCVSQPIIESSSGIKFGNYQFYYPQLAEQFQQAKISVFNNYWSNIHDFTATGEEVHYSLISPTTDIKSIVQLPDTEEVMALNMVLGSEQSVVPLTHGKRRKPSDENSLVVFFEDGTKQEHAMAFIKTMGEQHSECVLIQSKEITLDESEAQRIFGSDSYNQAIKSGPLVGMEYCGDGCVQFCQKVLGTLSQGWAEMVFASSDVKSASGQVENFFNYASMQMGA